MLKSHLKADGDNGDKNSRMPVMESDLIIVQYKKKITFVKHAHWK